MRYSGDYALFINGVRFSFREEEQLKTVLTELFAYCEDRSELYYYIVGDNIDYVLGSAIDGETSDKQITHLRAVKVLRDMYGDIFDPDKTAFNLLEDNHNILGQ
jgi:hypothetical protein